MNAVVWEWGRACDVGREMRGGIGDEKRVYLIKINRLFACMKLSNIKNILNREYLVEKRDYKVSNHLR